MTQSDGEGGRGDIVHEGRCAAHGAHHVYLVVINVQSGLSEHG